MKRKPVTTATPHFTEKELMQKPRPSLCVVIRGSKVNSYQLNDVVSSDKKQNAKSH